MAVEVDETGHSDMKDDEGSREKKLCNPKTHG